MAAAFTCVFAWYISVYSVQIKDNVTRQFIKALGAIRTVE